MMLSLFQTVAAMAASVITLLGELGFEDYTILLLYAFGHVCATATREVGPPKSVLLCMLISDFTFDMVCRTLYPFMSTPPKCDPHYIMASMLILPWAIPRGTKIMRNRTGLSTAIKRYPLCIPMQLNELLFCVVYIVFFRVFWTMIMFPFDPKVSSGLQGLYIRVLDRCNYAFGFVAEWLLPVYNCALGIAMAVAYYCDKFGELWTDTTTKED